MLPKEKDIYDLVFSLPMVARLDVLTLSIIQREKGDSPNALRVLASMIAVTETMAAGVSAENRFKLSARMRDAADQLEQPAVKVC